MFNINCLQVLVLQGILIDLVLVIYKFNQC